MTDWTVTTAMAFLQRQHDDLEARLQERFESQTKAVDAALLAQQAATHTALLAAEKAVTKAELAADKRFEAVNEFRAQLADQAATLLSRAEAAAKFEAMTDKIDALRLSSSSDLGRRRGLSDGWGVLIAVAGLALSIAVLLLAR